MPRIQTLNLTDPWLVAKILWPNSQRRRENELNWPNKQVEIKIKMEINLIIIKFKGEMDARGTLFSPFQRNKLESKKKKRTSQQQKAKVRKNKQKIKILKLLKN